MDSYKHFVSGFFTHPDQVNTAIEKLRTQHIPPERIHWIQPEKSTSMHLAKTGNNHVLNDVLMDGAAGVAVGTGVGIAVEIALITANISLFVASPIIAPLVLLGWGAGLGGFLGAAVGASNKIKPFSALVDDAIKHGQHVVIAETYTEQETINAQQVIKALTGEFQETI